MRHRYHTTTPPTLQLEGCLELTVAEPLQLLLRRSLRAAPEGLVLDLREVEWIDCRALGVLVVAGRQARRHGQLLWLRPSPRVRRLAELCGVADQLSFTVEGRVDDSRTGAAESPAGHR